MQISFYDAAASLRAILVAAAAVLMPVAAHSTPVAFRIDFTVEEIVSGCASGLPCAHADAEHFFRTFTVDSARLGSAGIGNFLVPLSHPLDYHGDGALASFLELPSLHMDIGQGTVDLNTFAAQPYLPVQTLQQICVLGVCVIVLSGGVSFAAGDGHWVDRTSARVAGVDASATVSGSYTISQISEVPLPPALALFATGLAGLGWLARRRKKQAALI
jgi:hypothetical protein